MTNLPGPNPPLLSSWKGNSCWCCGMRFVSDAGVHLVNPNEHHVVPRACGGTYGPTVSLASDHHELLHRMADAALARKPWTHLCAALPPESQQRITYLANIVVTATRATGNDSNKRYLLSGELPPVIGNKLRALASYYGVSHTKVLALLIEQEHTKLSL